MHEEQPETGRSRVESAPGVPRQHGRRAAEAAGAPAGEGRGEGRGETRGEGRGETRRRAAALAKRHRRRRVLKWTAGTGALVMVAGCGGAYYLYRHFNDNLTSVKVQLGDEAQRPRAAGDALNVLVIGTDSREGLGREYGDEGSAGHADTTLLFHIAKDRSNATVVSLPRDLMVPIPECQTPQGKKIPGSSRDMFNNSLGQDGRDAGCTWKTLEKATGIRVDHFVQVNFEAVKTLSSAVGGVEVCAAKNIDDEGSHLKMTKGRHVVQGEEALAFVRTRHAVGQGGDLTRIPLQQQFISSMIRKIKSDDTLTSPTKLYKLADAATKALTVDSGIGSVDKLKDLALDISKVDTKNITFTTVPVLDDPKDVNRLVLKQPDAGQLFAMIAGDRSLTGTATPPAPEGSAAATPAPAAPAPATPGATTPAVDAKGVQVTVRNGSGRRGQSGPTVDKLKAKGFALAAVGSDAPVAAATTVSYPAGQEAAADALAAALALPGGAVRPGARTDPKGGLLLVLGKDVLAAPTAPAAAPTEAPEDLQRVQADDTDVCAK
ncbi:LCP family protein [Streptomyces sp. NRRL S-350]|uniref:LCP family protein n=1 Tax=Streptomyces sp. NRRL S-350 TaxID=1463902 RepID=UPI000AA3EBA6|nr:LCP family protein [Streptomyces sp. NRRL S-350]